MIENTGKMETMEKCNSALQRILQLRHSAIVRMHEEV